MHEEIPIYVTKDFHRYRVIHEMTGIICIWDESRCWADNGVIYDKPYWHVTLEGANSQINTMKEKWAKNKLSRDKRKAKKIN